MNMQRKKPITMEKLAVLTQDEFRRVDQRFERLENKVDHGFKAIVDVLDVMRGDLHDVKISIGPLVRTATELDNKVRHLDKRVARLEEKAGFGK